MIRWLIVIALVLFVAPPRLAGSLLLIGLLFVLIAKWRIS